MTRYGILIHFLQPAFAHYASLLPSTLLSPYLTPPKSQAIKSPGHVWLSGQIPADSQGNLIKGSMTEQAQAIIKNTEEILLEAESSLENVVKVVVGFMLWSVLWKVVYIF